MPLMFEETRSAGLKNVLCSDLTEFFWCCLTCSSVSHVPYISMVSCRGFIRLRFYFFFRHNFFVNSAMSLLHHIMKHIMSGDPTCSDFWRIFLNPHYIFVPLTIALFFQTQFFLWISLLFALDRFYLFIYFEISCEDVLLISSYQGQNIDANHSILEINTLKGSHRYQR